jgi:hypothetical protein
MKGKHIVLACRNLTREKSFGILLHTRPLVKGKLIVTHLGKTESRAVPLPRRQFINLYQQPYSINFGWVE